MSEPAAKSLVERGALLVDVRTPEEYGSGHLIGARNIPLHELEFRKDELPRNTDIVLYCRSGSRSARARAMLRAAGFSRVHNLGAMSNWK
ncbi:MAG: rhodanese-like domain-containing protein [Myxococcaceae bacterium]|nr:rhodanese-like domain-containing protein [Myxococcaceae bacterium]